MTEGADGFSKTRDGIGFHGWHHRRPWDEQTRLFEELPNRSARIAVFKVNTDSLKREFLDIAATEMISLNDPFMVVKRLSKDHSGVIAAEDGNTKVIYVRAIEWTDCHEVEWKSYLADRVLMATSKH